MKKVVCIGSVTTDIIVSPADSIPTPGTLRSVGSISSHVGGCASNAAIDLAKIGIPVILSCKVGADSFGDFVKETAEKSGVDICGVVTDPSCATTVSIACVNSSGERSFLYNPGSTSVFHREDISSEITDACDIIFVAGAMLLTEFDGEPCAAFLKEMQRQGKYTVMDTAWDFEDIWMPKVEASIPYLDLFMPSYGEASMLTGKRDIREIAEQFIAMGAKNVIIKDGSNGVYIRRSGRAGVMCPPLKTITPKDTTGAGDSYCAGFLAGLSQDWSYEECADFASVTALSCIMEIGASTGIWPMDKIAAVTRQLKRGTLDETGIV